MDAQRTASLAFGLPLRASFHGGSACHLGSLSVSLNFSQMPSVVWLCAMGEQDGQSGSRAVSLPCSDFASAPPHFLYWVASFRVAWWGSQDRTVGPALFVHSLPVLVAAPEQAGDVLGA